jgi:NADH-quinone oxidoreductase subunit H
MYEYLFNIFSKNMVNIPLIQPLIDVLLNIPIINFIVALIFWKPVFAILVIPGLGALMLALLFLIWFERKVVAKVQWRYGPLEISRPIGGLLQPIADGIRYFFQEVIVHRDAHRPYFIQLPILSFIPALLPILVIPAGRIYAIKTVYAIPIIVALIALIPITIVAIGWASNSRFAYIGTVREAFMYFGYEIPFIIAVLAMILMYGSADAFTIVQKQSIPGILLNPLACFAFLIATAMATSRFPFEIPEADQEIAFGPFVEYSGIIFGIVMTLAYEKLYLMCLLLSLLFLGGWNGLEIYLLGDLAPAISLYLKTIVLMMILVFLRSIYPRLRLDQAVRVGWSSLLSLSLISLTVAGIVKFIGWF